MVAKSRRLFRIFACEIRSFRTQSGSLVSNKFGRVHVRSELVAGNAVDERPATSTHKVVAQAQALLLKQGHRGEHVK